MRFQLFPPADITVESSDGNPVIVTYPEALIVGGKSPVTIKYSKASGDLYSIGSTTIDVTATDKTGRKLFAQFIIKVQKAGSDPIILPVDITTTTLLPGVVGSPYNQTIQVTGGIPPYTFTIIAGSLPAGLSFINGVISGNPTVQGNFNLTIKAEDTVNVFDTQAYTIAINPAVPIGGAGNDYFNGLIIRSDLLRGLSFRPVSGRTLSTDPYYEKQLLTTANGGYQSQAQFGFAQAMTYNPANDTDPNAIDATKIVIPPFSPGGALIQNSIGIEDPAVLYFSSMAGFGSEFTPGGGGKTLKLENEVLEMTARDNVAMTFTVSRGSRGTAIVSHAALTPLQSSINTVPSTITWPFPNLADTDKIGTLVLTYDLMYTSSYLNTGLTNHKTFQIEAGNDAIWFEHQSAYDGDGLAGFNTLNNICAFSQRFYGDWHGSDGWTSFNPIRPLLSSFIINPNKIVRMWYVFVIRDIVDSFNHLTCKLTQPMDASQLTMQIDITGEFGGIILQNYLYKIGNEIVKATDNGTKVSGNIWNVPIVRGQFGTTPNSHLTNDPVSGSVWTASVWIADEDRNAVQLLNGVRIGPHAPDVETARNRIFDWIVEWNTSTNNARNRWDRDIVSYVRNACWLMAHNVFDINYPVNQGLLIKPTRS